MGNLTSCCCPCILDRTPTLRINGANFEILDILGEGGFSYVYLVRSSKNKAQYAMKKVDCPYGNTNFQYAMKEVENYKEFKSPYIMRSIDSSVVQEKDGSKTIYILLPYFENGTLQDVIDRNSVNNSKADEEEALRLFIGVCRGLISMHRHQLSKRYQVFNSMNQQANVGYAESIATSTETAHDEQQEDDPFLSSAERDTVRRQTLLNQPPVHPADYSSVSDQGSDVLSGTEMTETVSMAHFDIKPGNVMISKDGTPVLGDLGSCGRAQISVHDRFQAITVQEQVNEHCTLPYRAPELLDIGVNDEITEKVDIWSLGCTLYALLYCCSPFEREEILNGANISLAIQSDSYTFPNEPAYHEGMQELIKFCLVIDPAERPAIEDVLNKALEVQAAVNN